MSNVRVQASYVGTAAQFTTSNPVMLAGEFGYETDSTLIKLGDGTTAWTSLPYWTAGTAAVTSVAGKTGVVVLVKGDVGLGNVDNTSDANKPVSTAQASAIATAQGASLQKSSNLSDLTSASTARSNIGLGNVDNTSDANKPVSTAQASADAAATAAAQATSLQKTSNLSDLGSASTARTNLGIGNVDNTSDANKPVSTAQAASIATKLTNPITDDGDLITRISGVISRLGIGGEDFILRSIGGLPSWEEENLMQDIGDGSDGSLTLTGALTAPDNLYYTLLKPDTGGVLNPDAYIIYAKTLDLSSAHAASISRSGNAGANVGANTGGAGGAAFTARVLATNGAGGAGAAGASNAGVQGAAGGAVTIGNGGNGGASGVSGAGGSGAAAAAISGGVVTTTMHFGRFEYGFLRGGTQVSGGAGGRGGNSGGGDGANTSRGGGGGGAGGAVLILICGEIITSGSTPSGVITAKGGNGGKNTNAPATGNVGGSSGAGGGGGGYIYCAYVKKTGPVVANLFDASGGNGGDGSPGLGTGIGGNGGAGGNGGRIQLFNITTGVGTLIVGGSGALGTTGSGTTPGVGGAGGSCVASL